EKQYRKRRNEEPFKLLTRTGCRERFGFVRFEKRGASGRFGDFLKLKFFEPLPVLQTHLKKAHKGGQSPHAQENAADLGGKRMSILTDGVERDCRGGQHDQIDDSVL